MSAEYDAEKLRNLAKQTEKAGKLAIEAANDPLKCILQEIPDNFKGKAADALYQSVSELQKNTVSLSAKIFDIQAVLRELSDQVDAADQQLKEIVISN